MARNYERAESNQRLDNVCRLDRIKSFIANSTLSGWNQKQGANLSPGKLISISFDTENSACFKAEVSHPGFENGAFLELYAYSFLA